MAKAKRNPAKAIGRPRTSMTEENITAILRAISVGLHPDRAAEAAGVPAGTFRKHKVRDKEFAARVKEAIAKAEESYLGRILLHTEKQWTACAWILERRWPERWAKREVVAPQNKDDARRLAADVRAIIAQESDATPTSTPQAPQGGEATS